MNIGHADDALAEASPDSSPLPLDRKRILLIAPQPFFQWRGASFRVRLAAQALTELGAEVDLLTLPFGADVDIPGVRIIRAPNVIRARDLRIGPSPAKAAFALVLLRQARRLIRNGRYDVVHCFEEAALIGALLRRNQQWAFVYEKLSDLDSYREGRVKNAVLRLYGRLEGRAARRADAIIVGAAGMVGPLGPEASGKPVHCIFDAPTSSSTVRPGEAAELRTRFAGPNDVLAVFVGSFTVYQGIEVMFEAMPEVVAAQPRVRFVVIGGSDEEVAVWRQWLEERGLGEVTHLVGRVDPERLPTYLAAADILMLPRLLGTNIPMKVFDYLRAGRAIAATDVAANRAVLDDSTASFSAPTPSAFAGCVARLAADPERRQRLARKAAQLAAERYDFRAFKRGIADCYLHLGRPAHPQKQRAPGPLRTGIRSVDIA